VKLIVISAALAAFAAPALAAPGIDAFKSVCGDTHADFPAVKAALGAPGWTVTEADQVSMPGVTPTEGIARKRVEDGSEITVNAWTGTKGNYHLTACTVKVTKITVGSAVQETQAWLGFAPESTAGDKTTWRYGESGSTRAAVQKDGYEAAAAGSGLFFLNVFADNGLAVIDLLKIKS
jgi:hypothetical protein